MSTDESAQAAHDPDYLRNEQYRDSTNLDARKAIHQRFSTNPGDWFRWIFDRYRLPADATVLELGTGPADLWVRNRDRIPAGWRVTLSDFSPGMLETARGNLGADAHRFTFREIDARQLPCDDGSMDAVIANHMLYHVPDRAQALHEIHRVLKPGGKLYAATNGRDNMRELDELVTHTTGQAASAWSSVTSLPFTLENGAAQLRAVFHQVDLVNRDDALVVTEAEALVAYVRASSPWFRDAPERADQFRRQVAAEITAHGAIRISKSTGLFIATKRT